MALATLPALGQHGLRERPLGFCFNSSLASAAGFSSFTCASFTGTGSGTTLTASSGSGQIQAGRSVTGTGVPAGTMIVGQILPPGAGEVAGGAGRYETSNPTTSSGASLTTSGAPQIADYAYICVYTAAVNFRDDGTAPTGTGGETIAAGSCIDYAGNFSQLQFTQQSSGAVVSVRFYNSATQ